MRDKVKEKELIVLINAGVSFKEISKKLGCAISTVSATCSTLGLTSKNLPPLPDKLIVNEIISYYKTHTAKETAAKFGYSVSQVKRYVAGTCYKLKHLAPEIRRANDINAVKKIRLNLKIKAVEYKGGCCNRCGYDKYYGALEFHHKDPSQKDFSISQRTMSWDKTKAELDKCDMLCSNCHREVHHELRQAI